MQKELVPPVPHSDPIPLEFRGWNFLKPIALNPYMFFSVHLESRHYRPVPITVIT